MAASKPPLSKPSAGRQRPGDAVERLYVYWIVSTLLLLFALIVATVYTRGALFGEVDRYNQRLGELADRVVTLENTVAELRRAAVRTPAGPARQTPGQAATEGDSGGERNADELVASAEPEPAIPPGSPSPAPIEPAPLEAEIQTLLDQALRVGTLLPYAVADRQAAEDVLTAALKHVSRAEWSAPTWSRLAVLARLMSQNASAEVFARRAYNAGDSLLLAYAETSARLFLARGRTQEALMHAEHLAEKTEGAPASSLLLARVFLALGSPATADELLALVDDHAALSDADKLALARVCLGLHHWSRLADVVATVKEVPAELDAERNFLHAVALVQTNDRLAEALGILDYLADRNVEDTPVSGGGEPALIPVPAPNAYEIATWRGVALMRGQQTESARQALNDAAELRADRPEAYYWRAMLEIRERQFEIAAVFLQKALATSARFAPAWETLGLLALNRGELDAALQNLAKAAEANQRQASTHFLIAIAHAKASRREPAAEALQRAFQLDRKYVEKARSTDVLTRLFTPEDFEALATAEAAEAPQPEEVTP